MADVSNRHLVAIWSHFFVQESYHAHDPRNKVVQLFYGSLASLDIPIQSSAHRGELMALINVCGLQSYCGVSDLLQMLSEQPDSLLNCLVYIRMSKRHFFINIIGYCVKSESFE